MNAMTAQEKQRLLALLDREQRWCQNAEAQNDAGDPVTFDDASATAWDLTGAMCLLFGWKRACELFAQLAQHISGGQPDSRGTSQPEIDSLAALQDYNDDEQTTYENVVTQLRSMPVSRGDPQYEDDLSGAAQPR
jgi:hypothetical protein